MVLCVIFELDDTSYPGNTQFLKLVYLDLERPDIIRLVEIMNQHCSLFSL